MENGDLNSEFKALESKNVEEIEEVIEILQFKI